MKNKLLRVLSLLLIMTMLFGIVPAFALTADEGTGQPLQTEAKTTDPPGLETVPEESTVPSLSTGPIIPLEETATPTVPEASFNSSIPVQADEIEPPTETILTAIPEPERDGSSIRVGDTVLLQENEMDDRTLARKSEQVIRWENLYSGDIYYNYYVYDSGGNPVLSWSGGYVNELTAFVLSDQSIAYCLQPHKSGPTGSIYQTSFQDWDNIKREGITRAMAYGGPNNGDRSKECMLATALIIWDVACGYRRENGERNFSGTTPFEDVAAKSGTTVKNAYDTIIHRMKIHGMIPSFTVKNEGSIGNANTIVLKRTVDGNYVGTIRDTNGILPAFQFVSPMSGLTITRSGGTLNITATPQAAPSLTNGVTIRSRRSSAPIRDTDLLIWTKDGLSSSNREYQEIVSMPGGIDPVPCFFRIRTEVQPGTATLQKTSDMSAQGYCFKLYRWENSKSWFGRTDANGNMYETDSSYNTKTGTYEWKGLTDGNYAIKEVLSVYGKDLSFPTSMKLTVTDANGRVSIEKTFGENEIVKDPNGDAYPSESKIHLTGLTNGGKLTIQVHNDATSVAFSLKKSIKATPDIIAQLQGNACYTLEGAEYSVYKDGVLQEVMKTDAAGNAISQKKYPVGTVLTIEETKAPGGYKIDTTPYSLTIQETENVLNVADEPVFDPNALKFEKKDPITGQAVPQGNAKFEGAIFKWEYFDNQNWSGTPTRVWYFSTDEAGWHGYQSQYLANGYDSNPLYLNERGKPSLPVGSIRISEIEAPLGYGQIQTLYANITQESNGSIARFRWTPESAVIVQSKDGKYLFPEPVNPASYGSVSIQKTDALTGGGAPDGVDFSGCEFTIYNQSANPVKIGDFPIAAPGEACYVLTVDEAGKASTGDIFPLGSYTIKETKGNAYYQCNTEWSQAFEIINEGNTAMSFTVSNAPVTGHIQLTKVDSTTGKPLTGAVFQVTFPDGSVVNMVEGEKGVHSLKDLHYGTYKVQEIKAPEGFQLDSTVYTVDITENDKTYEIQTPGHNGVANAPVPGSLSVQKVDTHGNAMEGVTFLLEYSLDDGGTWQPILSRSDTEPLNPGTSSTQGIVDGKLTTDADGKITFTGLRINSQTGNIRYRLTEIATTNGHALLAGTAFDGFLPQNDLVDVQIHATNGTSFELPASGGHGIQTFTTIGAVLLLLAAIIPAFNKKQFNKGEKTYENK